ncbi:two pore domain potassium channel family protein [archaeon]|nr:MAG: two pore domain potassium channel family protein [archaeon]
MMQDLTTTIKAIRAHPHYKGTRNLFILFLYLLVGCLAYGELEGWHFGRSLSFTVVTITTVGYGYHTPSNDASRLFTIFYIIFGIIYVFAIVSEFVQGQLSKFSDILQKRLVSTEEIGADYQNNRRLVVYNVVAIILTILLGGVVLMTLEDWTFIQGVYFALETSTVCKQCARMF